MVRLNYIKERTAFTLVEVLVVVSIFALLSTIGLVNIRSSKNLANLSNAKGLLASAVSKVQGYTRAGRSFDRTPASGSLEVPRSFGITVDKTLNPDGFRLFADFPPAGLPLETVPHCYSVGGVPGCDPYLAAGSPKADSLVEDKDFASGIQVSKIEYVKQVPSIQTVETNRIDLVYLVPTAETVLYYEGIAGNMVKFDDPAEKISVIITLFNPASNSTDTVTISGGIIGGTVK